MLPVAVEPPESRREVRQPLRGDGSTFSTGNLAMPSYAGGRTWFASVLDVAAPDRYFWGQGGLMGSAGFLKYKEDLRRVEDWGCCGARSKEAILKIEAFVRLL
ncbi:hypothetical protein T265_11030 [Opisthorchis viverrini]|uniref:Uncharacterized protein n=1 Tax=Opisthorchis viverrini TaxID=6198 RepID=A0A074Z038_OPIVI|nr:hypothetical protein T265_11030 [Opisthorchis viverrini]KER20406.1 hypothetical protein T265_11030 [Opisthorchis viverrini]